jgi:hypothetical protein
MDKRLRTMAQRAAGRRVNDQVEDRVVSPLANKVGGCATVIFIVSFTALGVGAATAVGRMAALPTRSGLSQLGLDSWRASCSEPLPARRSVGYCADS